MLPAFLIIMLTLSISWTTMSPLNTMLAPSLTSSSSPEGKSSFDPCPTITRQRWFVEEDIETARCKPIFRNLSHRRLPIRKVVGRNCSILQPSNGPTLSTARKMLYSPEAASNQIKTPDDEGPLPRPLRNTYHRVYSIMVVMSNLSYFGITAYHFMMPMLWKAWIGCIRSYIIRSQDGLRHVEHQTTSRHYREGYVDKSERHNE